MTARSKCLIGRALVLTAASVVDAGGDGIALIDIDPDGVVVRPATSTDVWLQLSGLLPGPDELPAGASEASG